MTNTKECKHENCHCPASNDTEYCSTQCQAAADQDITELKCDCGHPGCHD